MNILLNLYPVSTGGGQQVALTLINMIHNDNLGHQWFFLTGSGTECDILVKDKFNESYQLSLNYSYLNRFLNRYKIDEFIYRNGINLVYNFGPILNAKNIPEVVRSVYSNLYFPEINFWNDYPLHQKLFRTLKDKFRLKGTLDADGLIFENRSMRERSITLFNFDESRTVYIKPSIAKFDSIDTDQRIDKIKNIQYFKVLYLSTWHLNKNFQILPHVAKILKVKGVRVTFVLTISDNSEAVKNFLSDRIKKYDVSEYFEFIGNVEAHKVGNLIKSIDSIILLSKLECFSSNVIESIYFKKPLIITEADWSKSECESAACYVDRNDATSIADAIIKLKSDNNYYSRIQLEQSFMLERFNTPELKYKKQVDFLKYIYELGKKKH